MRVEHTRNNQDPDYLGFPKGYLLFLSGLICGGIAMFLLMVSVL